MQASTQPSTTLNRNLEHSSSEVYIRTKPSGSLTTPTAPTDRRCPPLLMTGPAADAAATTTTTVTAPPLQLQTPSPLLHALHSQQSVLGQFSKEAKSTASAEATSPHRDSVQLEKTLTSLPSACAAQVDRRSEAGTPAVNENAAEWETKMAALQGRIEGVERWNREHARLSLELMDTVKPLVECLETRDEVRIAELSKEVESLREESRAHMEKLEKFGYDLEKRLDAQRAPPDTQFADMECRENTERQTESTRIDVVDQAQDNEAFFNSREWKRSEQGEERLQRWLRVKEKLRMEKSLEIRSGAIPQDGDVSTK